MFLSFNDALCEALVEIEFITNSDADVFLNTGPNAAANRLNVANAIRDAIVDDLINQP